MKKTYSKLVILEYYDSSSPFIYEIKSSKPITLKKVTEYFRVMEGFNENIDGISFIEPIEIKIK